MIGWKYIKAHEASQKYKEGMYILETGRVVGGVAWEEEEGVDTGDDDVGDSSDVDMGDDEARVKGKGKARQSVHDTTARASSSLAKIRRHHHGSWEDRPVFGMDGEEDEDGAAEAGNSYANNDGNARRHNNNNDTDSDSTTTTTTTGDDEGEKDDEDDDDNGDVLFDSQDEDECDELFAGIWDADVVRQRRRRLSRSRVAWVA